MATVVVPARPYLPYPMLKQRPGPVPHAATWPDAGLVLVSIMVAMTARVMDYQSVLLFGTVALLAGQPRCHRGRRPEPQCGLTIEVISARL